MGKSNRCTIDPKTGLLTFYGPLEIIKGEHAHIPHRPKPFPEAEQPFREVFFHATVPKSNSNSANRPSPFGESNEAPDHVSHAFLEFEKEDSHHA